MGLAAVAPWLLLVAKRPVCPHPLGRRPAWPARGLLFRLLSRGFGVALVKVVDPVPPHRHEGTGGQAVDRLPFALDRGQRVPPDGMLAPALALRHALVGG